MLGMLFSSTTPNDLSDSDRQTSNECSNESESSDETSEYEETRILNIQQFNMLPVLDNKKPLQLIKRR
jgi:hypothetical protein